MMLNSLKRCFVQINLICMLSLQATALDERISARVSLNVSGTGFHRNLIYRVDLDNFMEGCYVAIHLQLPPALYTNINELSNLRRLGISTACSAGETDTELFTEKAQPQSVTVCVPLLGTNCTLKLPIHQRYRYASENGRYVNITLPKPNLLLGCKKRIREHRISKLDLCSPCTELIAKWREISYNMDMEDVWTTPVGDTTLLPTVTYVTLLITILCTMFLVRTICKSVPIEHPKRE